MELTERYMPPEDEEFRQNIRKLHREQRDRMTSANVSKMSRMICERLLHAECYEKSRVIYGYYPLGNEVNCLPILRQALSDGKTVALPATGARLLERTEAAEMDAAEAGATRKTEAAHRMEFFRVNSLDEVAEGNFHVMEPIVECPVIQEERALVLVPGVTFDRSGNRYGYGGGYYDRYFSRFPGVYRAALCYEHQMEENLIVLDTDIKMHEIYTEKQDYVIGKS